MNIVKIETHVEDAQDRLPEQYRNIAQWQGKVAALIQEIQIIENMLFSYLAFKTFIDSEGVVLDRFGQFVGLERIFGESDEVYRARLEFTIFTNRSQATQDLIIEVVLAFSNATIVKVTDGSSASFLIQINGEDLDFVEVQNLYNAVLKTKGAGINLEGIVHSPDFNTAFCFDGGDGLGFSSLDDPTEGGEFAQLLLPGVTGADNVFLTENDEFYLMDEEDNIFELEDD
jgi:hypothetical protein